MNSFGAPSTPASPVTEGRGRVSIIVVAGALDQGVESAVESALTQTLPCEVVVACSRACGEAWRPPREGEGLIRQVIDDEGWSIAAAIESGVAASSGDYLAFLFPPAVFTADKAESDLSFYLRIAAGDRFVTSGRSVRHRSASAFKVRRRSSDSFLAPWPGEILFGTVDPSSVFAPRRLVEHVISDGWKFPDCGDLELLWKLARSFPFANQPRDLAGRNTGPSASGLFHGQGLALLRDGLASVPEAEKVLQEGSSTRYYSALADALPAGVAPDALDHLRRRAASVLSEELVSVILPFGEPTPALEQSIQSVLGQTHHRLELVLVNDSGMPDPFAGRPPQDARLRVVTTSRQGPALTRNVGMLLAKGNYLCFLDPSSTFAADKIEKQLQAMHVHGDVVSSTALRFLINGEEGHIGEAKGMPILSSDGGIDVTMRTSTVMMHRLVVSAGFRFVNGGIDRTDFSSWLWLARRFACRELGDALTSSTVQNATVAIAVDQSLVASALLIDAIGVQPKFESVGLPTDVLADVRRGLVEMQRSQRYLDVDMADFMSRSDFDVEKPHFAFLRQAFVSAWRQ